jgi:hypothetical protein
MSRKGLIAGLGMVAIASTLLFAEEPKRPSNRPRYFQDQASHRNLHTLPTGLLEQLKGRRKIEQAQEQPLADMAKPFDEQILKIRGEFVDKIQQLLTAEQLEEMKNVIRYIEWRRTPVRGLERLKKNPYMFRILSRMLQCTDQQKQQIEVLLQQFDTAVKSLGEDENSKAALGEATYNEVLTLLTPEQQKQVQDEFWIGGDREGRLKRETASLQEELSSKNVYTMPTGLIELLDARQKIEPAQRQTLDDQAKKYNEQIIKVRRDFIEKCRTMMTPEQISELENIIITEELEGNAPKDDWPGVAKKRPLMFRVLDRFLQYTDQQKQQIEALLQQYEAALNGLSESDLGTRRELTMTTYDQIFSLLTPEQQEKVQKEAWRGTPQIAPPRPPQQTQPAQAQPGQAQPGQPQAGQAQPPQPPAAPQLPQQPQ